MELQDQLIVLKVSGADAFEFLQGQLTNDINLAHKKWQLSAYCNPKGRVLALFSLWKAGDSAYLIVDKSLSERIVKRLRMYVMRSQVTIEVLAGALCVASIDDTSRSGKTFGNLEHTDKHTELGYGNSILRIHMHDKPNVEAGQRWSQSLMHAGIPQITAATTELFVPQMINLDLLEGINFKKGCYTGQEIVARMHYLGKLKQRMYLIDILKNPNDNLSAASKLVSQNGKNMGTVVNQLTGMASILAVLRTENVDRAMTFTTQSGSELRIAEQQPYALAN